MSMSAGGTAIPPFECDVLEPNGEVLVAIRGELDIATCGALAERLDDVVKRTKHVFLDLGGTTFIDGRGLRCIISAARQVNDHGHKLSVATTSPLIMRLLDRAPDAPDIPVVLV